MDTGWGLVTQTSPFLVRLSGDLIDVPVDLSNGETYAVGDKVAVVLLGTRWWVAGRIVAT